MAPFCTTALETKLSMKLWNRYTAEMTDGDITKSEIALKRGYLRIEPKFSDRVKGRFNLDFFSDKDGLDGAGIKIKYAYLDFNNLLPIPESKVSAGLIKNYFGTIYDWDYTTIQKALEDVEGVMASTDYGLSFYGYLPRGYGEYAVSITNGEGYKNTGSEIDKNPALRSNIRFIPVPGITIGGSVSYEDEFIEDPLTLKELDFAGVVHLNFGKFRLMAEYLTSQNGGFKQNGFMLMPVIDFNKLTGFDLELVGRYDNWDPNIEIDEDGHARIIGGINWYILRNTKNKPLVSLQLNGERKIFEDEREAVDSFMMQLRWSFSNTIM